MSMNYYQALRRKQEMALVTFHILSGQTVHIQFSTYVTSQAYIVELPL